MSACRSLSTQPRKSRTAARMFNCTLSLSLLSSKQLSDSTFTSSILNAPEKQPLPRSRRNKCRLWLAVSQGCQAECCTSLRSRRASTFAADGTENSRQPDAGSTPQHVPRRHAADSYCCLAFQLLTRNWLSGGAGCAARAHDQYFFAFAADRRADHAASTKICAFWALSLTLELQRMLRVGILE